MKKQARSILQSLTLVGIICYSIFGIIPMANAANLAQRVTPETRAQLIRVKQSVAFAENLQKEAKTDPQDIYQSLDNSLDLLKQLLNSSSLNPEIRKQLELIQSGVHKIRKNVNDTAAYMEVRALLEPITDNPGGK